jgi:hypothetical protein
MIFLDQLFGMNAILWFPRVVTVRVAFPFKEVFQLPLLSFEPVVDDGFHFIFVFSSDQFGWRSDEVWSVRGRFAIGQEE